jgi:hypothetical protein
MILKRWPPRGTRFLLALVVGMAWSGWITSAVTSARENVLPIDKGRIGDVEWFASVVRGRDVRGPVPCAVLVTRDVAAGSEPEMEFGESGVHVCGRLQAREAPRVVGDKIPGEKGMAVVVLGAPAARWIRLYLGASGTRRLPLRLIGRRRSNSIGLGPLRAAAFSVGGSFCLRRIVVMGAGSEPLYRSPRESCR